MHDTVEDTNDVSFEEIGNWFGSAVRRIVEGETRFSKIGKISGMTPGADVKAEDLRQLFLAMTEEVRIIVVKLADRLHNMRTLGSMKPEKQKKIAAETLQVRQAVLLCALADSKRCLLSCSMAPWICPEFTYTGIRRICVAECQHCMLCGLKSRSDMQRISQVRIVGHCFFAYVSSSSMIQFKGDSRPAQQQPDVHAQAC